MVEAEVQPSALLHCDAHGVTIEDVTERWERASLIPPEDERRNRISFCICCTGPCLCDSYDPVTQMAVGTPLCTVCAVDVVAKWMSEASPA